jgi:hypothetical protein
MLGVLDGLESRISKLDTVSVKKQAERVAFNIYIASCKDTEFFNLRSNINIGMSLSSNQ